MLKIDQVRAGYDEGDVLKGVSFSAMAGEVHGILGVNGSGKTTLFRVLNDWLSKREGTTTLLNEELKGHHIGFLETDPYFYPYMKGKEYLGLLKMKNEAYNIDAWNAIFDLPLDQLADEYSTGMKKKLALLGLLAQDRPVLILDEPLSGVDIESNVKFQEIILRLKESGKTILLSSHMLNALTTICDKISLLSGGVIKKTYEKAEFSNLESLITDQIKEGLNQQLDELF